MRGVTGRAGWVVLGAAIVVLGAISAWRGADTNWDERNYHLYNAFALLTGRGGSDIAPAQGQTFFPPAIDVARALLARAVGWLPLLHALYAVPQAAAVAVTWLLARRFAPGGGVARAVLATVATGLAATGAAGLPTLGSSQSEMPAGVFTMLAVLAAVRATERPTMGSAAAAGLLAGIAAGLKLTTLPFTIGVLASVALFAVGPRLRTVVVAGSAAAVAMLVTGGWWWLTLWHETGNPVFPLMNDLFRSDWLPAVNLADHRFMLHGVVDAVWAPVRLALWVGTEHIEFPTRDPRLALGMAAWCGAMARWRGLPRAGGVVLATACVAYALWCLQFGILRYLAPLELLCAPLLLMPARRVGTAAVGLACAAAACAGLTVYADWGHAGSAWRAPVVTMPALPDGTLVLLLDPAPMAYLALWANPSARFVGANNNMLQPGLPGALPARVEAAVRGHEGPIWGLESPRDAPPGVADQTLAFYGLRRGECVTVRSEFDADAVRACALARE